jgi:hypothetical protein
MMGCRVRACLDAAGTKVSPLRGICRAKLWHMPRVRMVLASGVRSGSDATCPGDSGIVGWAAWVNSWDIQQGKIMGGARISTMSAHAPYEQPLQHQRKCNWVRYAHCSLHEQRCR